MCIHNRIFEIDDGMGDGGKTTREGEENNGGRRGKNNEERVNPIS